MTEVRAIMTRKQLYDIPHLHFHVRFSRQGVLRFPFGENEALCFAIQYVNETAHGRICWQRYKIFAIQYVNETAHGRICWQRYKIFITKQH